MLGFELGGIKRPDITIAGGKTLVFHIQSFCVQGQGYKSCGRLATINQCFKLGGYANQVVDFTESLRLTETSRLEDFLSAG